MATSMISDKNLRLRSYFRRRPIPFKRLLELDLSIGSKSLMVQVNDELSECLYVGDYQLVSKFIAKKGIGIQDLLSIQADIRLNQTLNEDEEYSPNAEERKKKDKARKRESDGEYLLNPLERFKVLKSRKDSLMAKMCELDSLSGCRSFLLIVVPEKESAYYQGDSGFVHQFFGSGFSSHNFDIRFNIRPFEVDEVEMNNCSVPHCLVSRNTLSKWRMAALDLFSFPDNIPMTLYPCPEADRERWIAELDLNPNLTNGKLSVCSLHFKEGYPTSEYFYPTELLSAKDVSSNFQGTNPTSWRNGDKTRRRTIKETIEDILHSLIGNAVKESHSFRKVRFTSLFRRRKKKFHQNPPRKSFRSKSLSFPYKLIHFYSKRLFGPFCLPCRTAFSSSMKYFQHMRSTHFGLPAFEETPQTSPIRQKKSPTIDVKVSSSERLDILNRLYPPISTPSMNHRKKYVCAVCKSVCNLMGLYEHMKSVHKGILCLYCLKLFKKVIDLETHLISAHRVQNRYFASYKDFHSIAGTSYSFMCYSCSDFVHDLNSHKCPLPSPLIFECPYCDRVFPGAHQLHLHIGNGWCSSFSSEASLSSASKIYKVLTSRDYNSNDFSIRESINDSSSSSFFFNISDKSLLLKYGNNNKYSGTAEACIKYEKTQRNNNNNNNMSSSSHSNLPSLGNIFLSFRSRGISHLIKKQIKEFGVPIKSVPNLEITQAGKNFVIHVGSQGEESSCTVKGAYSKALSSKGSVFSNGSLESYSEKDNSGVCIEQKRHYFKESKGRRLERIEGSIAGILKEVEIKIRSFLSVCLICKEATLVCVDALTLLSHLSSSHGDSTSSEHFTIMKKALKDTKRKEIYFYSSFELDHYYCSYCLTEDCSSNADLFSHLELVHSQKVLTCNLCTSIFLNYGSFISHVCYGPPSTTQKPPKFNCKICRIQDLSSFLLFQNHMRRAHNVCEICFKNQENQFNLYHHCLLHSQELMCMKCFLSYDELSQFRKHLYYKHGSESRNCEECHHKTWSHVYHFCIPILPSLCEVCDASFNSVKQYRVHMRTHSNITPYHCIALNCGKSFISKQLLWKHEIRRHPQTSLSSSKALQDKRNAKELLKYKAASISSVRIVQGLLTQILGSLFPEENEVLFENSRFKERDEKEDPNSRNSNVSERIESRPSKETERPIDPIQAAVASIMGSDGIFNRIQSPPPQSSDKSSSLPSPHFSSVSSSRTNKSEVSSSIIPMHPSEYFAKRERDNGGGKGSESSKSESSDVELYHSSSSVAPVMDGIWNTDLLFVPNPFGKAKVRKPGHKLGGGLRVMKPEISSVPTSSFSTLSSTSITQKLGRGGWDVCLSESSDSDLEKPKKIKMRDKIFDYRISLMDHDYCYAAFAFTTEPLHQLSEMDKILSNVALGLSEQISPKNEGRKKHKRKKEGKKKHKKKKRKIKRKSGGESSSDSEEEEKISMSTPSSAVRSGPKPKYHTPVSGTGVTAATGRITFCSSSEEEKSSSELCSSDLDTDFSANEETGTTKTSLPPPSLKLKIRLPTLNSTKLIIPKRKLEHSSLSSSSSKHQQQLQQQQQQQNLSKKMRESLALNQNSSSADDSSSNDDDGEDEEEEDDEEEEENKKEISRKIAPAVVSSLHHYTDEKLYCVCQCPHDDVSEMIGCDASDCSKEWFHFECVGILVPPEGKWYCPDCTKRYKYRN